MQTKSGPEAAAIVRGNYNPIEAVLSRLDRVKKTAPDKWIALCPAHPDKRPSLSVKEAEDGKVLLHCWAGCGAAEIVTALGLSLADLFPEDRYSVTGSANRREPMRKPFSHRDALAGLAHEISVARILIERRDELDDEDRQRLILAEQRIEDGLRAVGGAQ